MKTQLLTFLKKWKGDLEKKQQYEKSRAIVECISLIEPKLIKLKPCPFCGAELEITKEKYGYFEGDNKLDTKLKSKDAFMATHPKNECFNSDIRFYDIREEYDLFTKWNRRVYE